VNNHFRPSWGIVLLCSLFFLLAGCGGGSGGSTAVTDSGSVLASTSSNNVPTTTPAPVDTTGSGPTGNGTPVSGTTPNTPPAAPVLSTDVLFQFLLARTLPIDVATVEFTGLGNGNEVLFGPENHNKAASITLNNVPLAVTAIRFRLFQGNTLRGHGLVPVSLTGGQTAVVTDPDFTPVAQPTSVSVTPGSDSIFVGGSVQLTAVQNYSDSNVSDITNSAGWSSSNTGQATVSSGGLVQGISAGVVTITAVGQGTDGTASITVIDGTAVTGLDATPDSPSVVVGTTQQLLVQATLASNNQINVTNDLSTQYTSLSPAVATVSASGLVRGVAPGTAQVEVTHGGQTDTVSVMVNAATLQSISLNLADSSVTVGQSTTATVTGNYDNGSSSDLTASATLGSSNTGVATTSGSTISGVSTGTVTITADVNGHQNTASLLVLAAPASPGLTRLNALRGLAGLPPVTENATYSSEAYLHSRYMVKNDFIGHSEDPNNPWYSVEGDRAARNSNLSVTSNLNAQLVDGIDGLLRAPFHGVGFIDPQLLEAGFGFYCENIGVYRCGTTVDVLRGLGALPGGTSFPILWPADGQPMPFTSYTGGEYPDPITGLGGITAPTGAPIYVQFGSGSATINVTNVTLTNNTTNSNVSVGYFDETSYVNPDSSAQSLGRSVLGARDCLVIMASSPLTTGHNYTCSVTNAGAAVTWSFTVSNVIARQQSVETPIELIR
jgi:uncharacterized protein YkwD